MSRVPKSAPTCVTFRSPAGPCRATVAAVTNPAVAESSTESPPARVAGKGRWGVGLVAAGIAALAVALLLSISPANALFPWGQLAVPAGGARHGLLANRRPRDREPGGDHRPARTRQGRGRTGPGTGSDRAGGPGRWRGD